MITLFFSFWKKIILLSIINSQNFPQAQFFSFLFLLVSGVSFSQSNFTLQQFGDLRVYADEWLRTSSYLMQSVQLLNKTLPMLKVSDSELSRTRTRTIITPNR